MNVKRNVPRNLCTGNAISPSNLNFFIQEFAFLECFKVRSLVIVLGIYRRINIGLNFE